MVQEMRVDFTDKKVTAWGGMKLMKDMLDSIKINEFMSGLDLPANHRMLFSNWRKTKMVRRSLRYCQAK